jgi:cell division septal protein FtsQ
MDEPKNEPRDGEANEPTEARRRLNRFQQFAVILLGMMMILTGVATIFEGQLFSPYFPAAALFAPFALAGGALVIALAIRAGRRH